VAVTDRRYNDVRAYRLNCRGELCSPQKEHVLDKVQFVVERLISKGFKIATAESCTGGLLAKTITDFPGCSAIFELGLVTYSDESKIRLLGVNPETLEKHSAVSREVALEMARGLKKLTNCDIAISITGIAGPEGATQNKSIGLVYVCINNDIHELNLTGDRHQIRQQTVDFVLDML